MVIPGGVTLLMELIQALGPMGFVMWMIHRNTSHTIPRLAKSFENRAKEQQTSFEKSLEQQRTDFKEMFALQREDYERITQREQEVHGEQIDKVVESLKELASDQRANTVLRSAGG